MQIVDGPEDAPITFLFAHGAGAGMDTPFMTDVAHGVAAHGIRVVRFEFPYMHEARSGEKRGGPDRMPVLEACFREQIASLGDPARIVLGGKSMGGRVATRIADQAGVRGVAALGYPFHPPKKLTQLRTEHLASLRTPCLILQGTRDPFGTRDEVAHYELSSAIEVHWLEDGDHSFAPRKASGRTIAQNVAEAVDVLTAFLAKLSR